MVKIQNCLDADVDQGSVLGITGTSTQSLGSRVCMAFVICTLARCRDYMPTNILPKKKEKKKGRTNKQIGIKC